jgi:hypothetical protein
MRDGLIDWLQTACKKMLLPLLAVCLHRTGFKNARLKKTWHSPSLETLRGMLMQFLDMAAIVCLQV